jgi:hypothetical protein
VYQQRAEAFSRDRSGVDGHDRRVEAAWHALLRHIGLLLAAAANVVSMRAKSCVTLATGMKTSGSDLFTSARQDGGELSSSLRAAFQWR